MKKYVLIGIMLLAGVIGCAQKNSPAEKTQAATQQVPPRPANAVQAPDFTLMSIDGELVSLSDLKGKVVLLNFWGTWCPPCRREIPDFIKLQSKYQSDGLEIVGITLSSGTVADIATFAGQWGMNYTILTDISNLETQEVAALFGRATGSPITGIPTTFVIDKDGYIRKSYVGPRTEAIFYNDLKPFL